METEKQFMTNAQGHLVPVELVADIDKLRDQTVNKLVDLARGLNGALRVAKDRMFSDIHEFIEISAEKYHTTVGGAGGNVTLTSFDGRTKVSIHVNKNIRFDERIQAAKALIDECIKRWSDGVNDNIRALVEHAFQTDQEGKINIGRVLGLTRLNITDEQWQQAMLAIRESMQVANTSTYVRVYERESADAPWKAISLDIAKL